ncbi:MAG: hypothetical protein AB8B63_14160 [Granulosicoccus sp.]
MPDHRIWLVFIAILAISDSPLAQESGAQNSADDVLQNEPGNEQSLGVFRRSIVIVDDAQRIASERFGNFMSQVDGFFSNAGSDEDAVSNESWARIRLDGTGARGDSLDLDPSLKLRAVLPRTEQKLKLLFSTEDDEAESVEGRDSVGTSADNGAQSASLALRFIRTARDTLDVNFDIGLRQRSGQVQTFVRVNNRFRTRLSGNWSFNAANNYYYYSKSGFENRLSFDFRRTLFDRSDRYFRAFSGFDWRHGRKGALFSQTVGAYGRIGLDRALAIEALGSYYTALSGDIRDRFQGHTLRLRWRHNIWRPWFFYEIWPSVSWPSGNDYERTEALLLRAEVIIGQQ